MRIVTNYSLSEEEKIDLLRNKSFIKNIDTNSLEQLLNNMKFSSVFNMLQNESILNKIKNLNLNIEANDEIIITSYLDSENLVKKATPSMLKKMLLAIERWQTILYLKKDYILKKLTTNNVIEISLEKDIHLIKDIFYIENLNERKLVFYINNVWQKKLDFSLINNQYVKNTLFTKENINYDEIIYLYEYINTKSVLTVQNNNHTIESFKAVISLYLLLGLDKAKKIIENGNKKINLSIPTTNEVIAKNFKVKDKIKRSYQNRLSKEYLKRCKVKILVSVLNSSEKDKFKSFFKNDDINKIVELYNKKFKNTSTKELIEKILIPYVKGKKVKEKNQIIITKTNNFLNYYLNNSYVNSYFLKELTHYENNYSYNIELSKNNYKLKPRMFCLDDITNVFKDTDINKILNKNNCQKFSNKYIPLIASGYYPNLEFNFGTIISNIDNLDGKTLEECQIILQKQKERLV